MKKISLIATLSVLAVFAAAFSAYSDDMVTGRWEGSFFVEGFGDLPIGMDLKADSEKLTGTYDGQFGPVEITNGKIKGNNLSFDLTLDIMGTPTDLKYEGVIKDTSMALKWTSEGIPPTEATVTKKE